MSDNSRYIVEIDVKVLDAEMRRHEDALKGQSSSLSRLEDAWKKLGSSIGGPVMGALDTVARKTFEISKYAVAGGAGAAIAGIAYGVGSLNSELESTTISLGTIFSAQGIARDVPAGMTKATALIKEMRKDAVALPGEFEDLLGFFQMGAIPAFQGGADLGQFEKLSAKAMAAAKVASLPMDMAAREFSQLLSGRSGAHNVFGMRLMGLSGEKAEAFNKMDSGKRLELLSKELEKYAGAIDAFGDSWDAQTSTMKDSAKQLLQVVTEPLFGRVKDTLKDANQWISANKEDIAIWADVLGKNLAWAFDVGKAKLREWWPLVRDFAETAWERLKGIWVELRPYVEKFGAVLKDALSDPNGTLDKLERIVKLYGAAKAAQAGSSVFMDTAKLGMSALPVVGMLAKGGGAAAAAETGVGAAAGVGESVAAGAGGSALLGGLATAGAALAALAAVSWAAYEGFSLWKEWTHDIADDNRLLSDSAQRLIDTNVQLGGTWEDVTARTAVAIGELRAQGMDAAASMVELKLAAWQAADELRNINRDKRDSDIAEDSLARGTFCAPKMAKDFIKGQGEFAKSNKHKGGAGGTHIQKVEIVVTSNQDPSRIARTVFTELQKLGRNRRSSPDVPNYSSPRT